MPPSSPSYRPAVSLLSSDDMVNELCAVLLDHETCVRAAQDNTLRMTQFELDQILRKIARCEGWLRILGKHTALANARARLPTSTADPVRPAPRVGLDLALDTALKRRTLPPRPVPRAATLSG